MAVDRIAYVQACSHSDVVKVAHNIELLRDYVEKCIVVIDETVTGHDINGLKHEKAYIKYYPSNNSSEFRQVLCAKIARELHYQRVILNDYKNDIDPAVLKFFKLIKEGSDGVYISAQLDIEGMKNASTALYQKLSELGATAEMRSACMSYFMVVDQAAKKFDNTLGQIQEYIKAQDEQLNILKEATYGES